jgi:hypothetical protein
LLAETLLSILITSASQHPMVEKIACLSNVMGYKNIVTHLTIKQKGLITYAAGKLRVISNVKEYGKANLYYHVRCAKMINLL